MYIHRYIYGMTDYGIRTARAPPRSGSASREGVRRAAATGTLPRGGVAPRGSMTSYVRTRARVVHVHVRARFVIHMLSFSS